VDQQIRFCTAPDGVRLAYAVHGHGPPIVRPATWLTHLEFDWASPVWRHWLEGLTAGHTLVRYDERGSGLSDREVGHLSVDTWVADLETVVDAVGIDRFALLGISQAAAITLAYAARHPERVSHLILYGGYARGRKLRGQRPQEEALASAIRAGWTDPDPTFRHVFSMLFLPGGTPQQMSWYDDMQRRSTSSDTVTNDAIAERLIISVRTVERHLSNVYAKLGVSGKAGRAAAALVAREIDADDVLTEIAVPVLVTHGRADRIVQPSMAEHVLDVCGSAEASWYDGVGHMPFLEAPARFDHELGQFVARVH
jgi:pimeloyl-ACP methyl ester carboxylesterase